MALILDESFITGIPADFATARAQAGTLTATYNATAQAVDLSNATAGQNIYDITSVPLTVAGEMEIDLELVADLSGASNYRHAGAWPVAGQGAVSNGFRLAHLLSEWNLIRWDSGSSWSGNEAPTTYSHGASDTFNTVGDRRILNLRWDMGSAAGVAKFSVEVRIDGVLRLLSFGTFPSLRPGIFLYQASVRLHSIKAWDAPQVALTPIGSRAMDSAVARRICAPPEALVAGGPTGYDRGATIGQRNIYQGGSGRVYGTVKEKGTPNAPLWRRVRLFDELNNLLVREQWSDPVTGAYSFDYVDTTRRYTVLSYDHTGAYRAVVADGQIPELIA